MPHEIPDLQHSQLCMALSVAEQQIHPFMGQILKDDNPFACMLDYRHPCNLHRTGVLTSWPAVNVPVVAVAGCPIGAADISVKNSLVTASISIGLTHGPLSIMNARLWPNKKPASEKAQAMAASIHSTTSDCTADHVLCASARSTAFVPIRNICMHAAGEPQRVKIAARLDRYLRR
jgi:hypothetical protein